MADAYGFRFLFTGQPIHKRRLQLPLPLLIPTTVQGQGCSAMPRRPPEWGGVGAFWPNFYFGQRLDRLDRCWTGVGQGLKFSYSLIITFTYKSWTGWTAKIALFSPRIRTENAVLYIYIFIKQYVWSCPTAFLICFTNNSAHLRPVQITCPAPVQRCPTCPTLTFSYNHL